MAEQETSKRPPLRQHSLAFLDVETTGLDPNVHEILEIAVVALDGSVLLDTKVKPVNLETAAEEALKINGYADHPELWEGAPTFDEIKDDVVTVLEHKIVVGQTPQFDRSFVVAALERVGVEEAYKKVRRHIIDTVVLAWEHLAPCGLERLSLDAICEFLGIPTHREKRHSALKDAQAVRVVYLMLLRATEEQRFAWRERAKGLGLLEE